MRSNIWNILGIMSWHRVTWPWKFFIEPGLRGVLLVLSDSSKLPSFLSFFEADPKFPPRLFISSQGLHYSSCFLVLLSPFSKIGCKGKHSPQLFCFLVIPQNHHMGLVFLLEVYYFSMTGKERWEETELTGWGRLKHHRVSAVLVSSF